MTSEQSDATRMMKFIREHVATTGQFPTNKEITRNCDVFPWRVASRLTQLVERGLIGRTKVGEKGTSRRPKYHYFLIEKELV